MYGIDYLGGAAFPNLVIKSHKSGWAAGFFAKTFGSCWNVVKKLAATGKAPAIRVHALWSDLHKYGSENDIANVKVECKRLCDIANQFPKVKFYFSPYCEHNLKAKDMEKTLAACRTIIKNNKCSNLTLVNCIWKGETIAASDVLNEVHGDHSVPRGKFIYSFDGLDCYNSNVTKKKQQYAAAQIFFFWTISMNLIQDDDVHKTVEQRLNGKYRPKECNIKAMIALAENKGATNVPPSVTIKPMSEDCGDLKSNKLLVLLNKKYNEVKIIRNNNQKTEIEKLRRFDPPTGNFYRYYASKAGYEYVKKRLVLIKADGKILTHENKNILFNPAFRDGTYRG